MPEEALSPLEHLAELRRRLLFCLIALFLGTLVGYFFYENLILEIIKYPLKVPPLAELNLTLHYISPLEGFLVKVKSSLFFGALLSFPFIFYQIWRFTSRGLNEKEKRTFLKAFPFSLILFAAGVLCGYFIVLPVGLYFLITAAGESLTPVFIISKYVSLLIALLLIFGAIFEVPLAAYALTRAGIITPQILSAKRKYAILIIFILAALLTPPDVFTQIILALPLLALYEISILVSKLSR